MGLFQLKMKKKKFGMLMYKTKFAHKKLRGHTLKMEETKHRKKK